MRRSRTGTWILLAVLATGVGAVIAMTRTRSITPTDDVPTAEVKRGEMAIEVHATGALSASHTVMLAAPTVGGDALQITHLAQTGERVRKGDVVVEFDPSEQNYKLEQ